MDFQDTGVLSPQEPCVDKTMLVLSLGLEDLFFGPVSRLLSLPELLVSAEDTKEDALPDPGSIA